MEVALPQPPPDIGGLGAYDLGGHALLVATRLGLLGQVLQPSLQGGAALRQAVRGRDRQGRRRIPHRARAEDDGREAEGQRERNERHRSRHR